MIEETARVVACGDGTAWVEVDRRSACGGCAVSAGCGTAGIARYLGRKGRIRLQTLDPLGVQPGEQVVIGLDERALMRGTLRMYALPLLSLLLGALAGQMLGSALGWGNGDPAALLGGALGFAAGLAHARRFSRRVAADPDWQPVVLRRAGGETRPLVFVAHRSQVR